MDDSTHKTCTRCEETKPRSEFHNRAKARDGLNPACKVCICAARRQHTAEHPERLAEARKRYDADPELHARKLERGRKWQAENPEHRADYYRRHYAANREKYAAWKRAWWEANREEVLARQATDHDGQTSRKMKRYRESHREVMAERTRRRYAIYKAGAAVGPIDLDALWTGQCGICGGVLDRALAAPDPMRKSLDHIWPLALGGDHVQENLQWAHLRCNISKGATPPNR